MNYNRKGLVSFLALAFLGMTVGTAFAADVTWNVGDGAWDITTENWAGDATTFTDGGVDNVTFNNPAGGTVTVDLGMTPLSTTVDAAEGTTYTFVESISNSVEDMIDGGTLVKNGLGTLVLGDDTLPPGWGDNNKFSNGFTAVSINAGTMIYRSKRAFGPDTTTVTMADGTTLIQDRHEGNGPALAVMNPFVLTSGTVGIEVFWGNKDIFLGGPVSGDGGFSVSGGGRGFGLGGDSTFTGGITMENSNARLLIGHYNALGTGTLVWEQTNAGWNGVEATTNLGGDETYPDGVTNDIAIAENGIFGMYGGNSLKLSGVISGDTGRVQKRHNGTLILAGANTYGGGTLVHAGTITVDGSLADADMTIDTGTVNGSGQLTFNIDGATSDLIQVINGGTLDITTLNIDFNTTSPTEEAYVLVDPEVVADPVVGAGVIVGTEFASATEVPGYILDYAYGPGGTQIALIAGFNTDLDGSGLVDDADLNLLLSNYDAGGVGGGEPTYNQENLTALLDEFGGAPLAGGAASAAVPEPTSALLVLLGLFGIVPIIRRRK